VAGQRPGGVTEYWGPDGQSVVYASTCGHCQHISEFPSMRVIHGYVDVCRGCMRLVCLDCAGKDCIPAEKWCEIIEKAGMRCDPV